MKLTDRIYKLSRWGIGVIFIYAGSMKLLQPAVFSTLIDAFGIVPEKFLIHVVVVLPILEIVAGIGLLFDIRGSLLIITGLILLFIAILIYGIQMGLDIDCGCFGPEDPEADAFHGLKVSLYRDLMMLAVAAFLYGWRRYRPIKPKKIMPMINKYMMKMEERKWARLNR